MRETKSWGKGWAALAPFLLALLSMTGCSNENAGTGAAPAAGGGPKPKSVKLAFITNNSSEFWKIAQAGIRKYEQESKVQVDVKMPPNGTTEEQNQILESLSSQGYDAIAVSAIAPNDQVPALNKAAERSKLITFDSDAPKSSRLLYIGTNNYEAGKALGAQIVKLLPSGGKMAVFVGMLSADNAKQRLQGIEDAIAGKNIEIVDKREDNTDRAKARSNVEDIINAHPDLKLVAGLWSYNGPAIAAAIEALGKKGKVLAAVFDEEEQTLMAIESGTISATVVQKPFQFGYLASKWAHELATKPDVATAQIPADRSIDTGIEVIEKTNVADFKRKLAEMKK
ncbi:sugar ABC transporter substrate-binding protein [Sorangium cellulosum]|uniref:Sugar ABC transporter substrate-binding protein n=1 Tax=Sorangium cellulosum TaxID=56 RepID=A0A2L0F0V1_SORCE|nr:sugar-binding protein [Sorangium cellulosum]AUX45156.1 sugar ABC transporter substrate-binding protein [Sorangium cellulosum]